jgi:hypothetical protein
MGNSPNSAFIAVDFPAPLGPTIDDISPSLTPISQLKRISTDPYPQVIEVYLGKN